MITGTLAQRDIDTCSQMLPVLRRCFNWIGEFAGRFPEGITELEGRALYVNVHGYETRLVQDCRWESHRFTADLQFTIEGSERIDWSAVGPSAGTGDYDQERDFEHWPEPIAVDASVWMRANRFVVFLPGELHRPMIASETPAPIRKLVFKIDRRLLVPS